MESNWLEKTRIQRLRADGFKCSICHATTKLHVHHIDGQGSTSKEQNNHIENLITLCHSCHLRLHSKKTWEHEAIISLRQTGYTMPQIATLFGLTRQRIHQILKSHANS